MQKPWIVRDIERRKKVARLIQEVLLQHNVDLPDFHDDIHVSDNCVVEHSSQEAGHSQAIFEHMFPREPSPTTLYHYTSLAGLSGIASSAELRLFPIRKRIDEGGELSAFAQAHGLMGYLRSDQREPFYKELSDDLFYVSMTRIPPKDPYLMWGAFSSMTGVRLEFEVTAKVAQLRPVYYERKGSTTLLADINFALRTNCEPPFVPFTISHIGAFYLSSLVSAEDEVRLMVKRYLSGLDQTRNDGEYDYWPIPIGSANNYCDLSLIGIHVAPNGDLSRVTDAIDGTKFASIVPTGP
jgi:hypothetical protein